MARHGKYDAFDDAALIRAARERVLSELAGRESRRTQAQRIINNIYGGGGVADGLSPGALGGGNGGAGLGTSDAGEDPYDYFVNIKREDLPDINPHTGKPVGWSKEVHRFRNRRDDDGDKSKKKAR
jgi:hypothetical protein